MVQAMQIDALKQKLTDHKQTQLLAFWDQLSEAEKAFLVADIENIDWSQLDTWIATYITSEMLAELPTDLSAATAYPAHPDSDEHKTLYEKARKKGQELISAGKVGAFVVAGGQGTRLGFDGPKGNYPASPIKQKTLFRLFAEQIAATAERYQTTCPWYIMTSPLNDQETQEIFQKENYFGLDPQNIMIFQQGTMPNFDFKGNILLADKGKIARSPDGHGGSLKALYDSQAVADMQQRGVEIISYWQVDNPLINIFDPLFIGLHVLDESEMSSKSLTKTHALEKVGNFCLHQGRVTVVEYSDLPDELAQQTNPDGSLVFNNGSIGIHLINRSFIEQLNRGRFGLPFHKAIKKIPHIDSNGQPVAPEEPNGVKLETFVFDALPLAKHSMILETLREQEFGPIKNATGVDSAESSRAMMVERAAGWLEAAGIKVPRKTDGTVDCDLEIAASFALNAQEVKAKVDLIPPLSSGGSYYIE